MFVSGDATILHADLDAFYASVEQRDDPRLRGRPVIVGGGVVLAASYEAKACGVRTAMGGAQARRLCPAAVVVSPRMSAYSEASKAVFEVFDDTTPLVEGLSIDEAFLDVGGLLRVSGTPTEIAVRLRREVLERVGLVITVGVARTKFLAKVASGVAKPDGLLVVPPDRELEFLHPLPVGRLWGVGPKTAAKLDDRGITTVGEVALLGEGGARRDPRARRRPASARARAQPRSAAGAGRPAPPLDRRAARARPRGRSRSTTIDAALVALVDRVARRLRAAERTCRTVVLRLRFDDFTRVDAVAHDDARDRRDTPTILAAARALLAEAAPMIERQGLTLVGCRAREPRRRRRRAARAAVRQAATGALDAALDDVRDRFGSSAVDARRAARPRSRPDGAAAARLSDGRLGSARAGVGAGTPSGRRRRRSPDRRSGCRCRSRGS